MKCDNCKREIEKGKKFLTYKGNNFCDDECIGSWLLEQVSDDVYEDVELSDEAINDILEEIAAEIRNDI